MKILYINAVCGVGSTGRIVTDLMQKAKKQGNTVKVACSTVEPIKGVEPGEVIVVGNKLDYYVHNMLSRITDHEGLYSRIATKRLIKQIQEYNPDIIHLHNLHGHWINYELLFRYLREENKKVIWTLHDCWAFTGHCAHFITFGCEKWKLQCTDCPGLKSYPRCYGSGDVKKNYERKRNAFSKCANIILATPSKWLAKFVEESFLGHYEIEVINNTIDRTIFQPRSSDFRKTCGLDKKIMVLGVSNVWSKNKGYEDFIKLRRILGLEYSIVLVGLSEVQIKELPEGIIGITRTHNATELAEIYSAADVFVNLTYQDTYPTVNLEALSCGTPIVTYDTGGSVEAGDETCCVIVPQNDLTAVVKAIDKARSLSREAALYRSRNYLLDNKYLDYNSLYKECL